MAKFQRKPLDKSHVIPKYNLVVLLPIVAYLLLTIWFWGNELASYLLLIGLAVVEMALTLIDALLRRRRGGRFDRGDLMVIGAGVIATVYMIYRIAKL